MSIRNNTPLFRDPVLARRLVAAIRGISRKPVRLMEVCGTHTMSIFKSGIRSLLPETIDLLSGPGCPVCVTDQGEIDAFIRLARTENVIVATFGDLIRVPGTDSSLQKERTAGRDIRIVYATLDALDIARKNPEKQVVFLGVGFETTAPTVAAAILAAAASGVTNFTVLSAHKRVVPALFALMETEGVRIDGFILPGHVSVIIGAEAYRPLFDRYRIPCTVAGFEPVDILEAIRLLTESIESADPKLANAYGRAVSAEGNPKALAVMDQVFKSEDAAWRGLGVIPESGLAIRPAFGRFDARRVFELEIPESPPPRGCVCGDILRGVKSPPECALFGTRCTPMGPVGPCMVSGEGTCAAFYRYRR